MSSRGLQENNSGYYDPVAAQAIGHVDKANRRFERFVKAFKDLCKYNGGYIFEGTITDPKTGKKWEVKSSGKKSNNHKG